LQDGDIISSVNGISLTGGLPQIMSLVEQHKNNPPKSISVDINRGGEIKTININLP
jgi:type II secretory pathway component PulC